MANLKIKNSVFKTDFCFKDGAKFILFILVFCIKTHVQINKYVAAKTNKILVYPRPIQHQLNIKHIYSIENKRFRYEY